MKRLQVGKLYKTSELYKFAEVAFIIYSVPHMDSRYSYGTVTYDETIFILEDNSSFQDEDNIPTYTPVKILDASGSVGYIYLASWDRNSLILIEPKI